MVKTITTLMGFLVAGLVIGTLLGLVDGCASHSGNTALQCDMQADGTLGNCVRVPLPPPSTIHPSDDPLDPEYRWHLNDLPRPEVREALRWSAAAERS
jgi:hypothetical protein